MPFEAGQVNFVGDDGFMEVVVAVDFKLVEVVDFEEAGFFVFITGILGGLAADEDVFALVLMTGTFGGFGAAGDLVVFAVEVDDFLVWLVDEVVMGADEEVDFVLVVDDVVVEL